MDIDLQARPTRPLAIDADDSRSGATDLTHTVEEAIRGDQRAWRNLYRRYNPLVISTAQRFRLSQAAIEDVSQTVWSLLFTHIERIHEPRALPGWIATTTRNEVYRTLRTDSRCEPTDPLSDRRLEGVDNAEPGEQIYRDELRQQLDELIDQLSTVHRRLMRLLMAEPQLSYAEISRQLSIPTGSIGPTRSRCLARMREHSRRRGVLLGEAA